MLELFLVKNKEVVLNLPAIVNIKPLRTLYNTIKPSGNDKNGLKKHRCDYQQNEKNA